MLSKNELIFQRKSITLEISKIFKVICKEKFNKTFAITFYRKKRWSSVNLMFESLKELSNVISFMPHSTIHERENMTLIHRKNCK